MERNFETVMIEQCAPVLASLKPAGLFRYETRDCADLARRVKNWNEQLQPKGLRVRVLKGCARTHQYLVYVYRESMLRAVLTDETLFLSWHPPVSTHRWEEILLLTRGRAAQTDHCTVRLCHFPEKNFHAAPVGRRNISRQKNAPETGFGRVHSR